MHPAILVGAGFLAGIAGTKAVTSECARKLCVKGIVTGMKVKEQCESVVEEAKAEFDDIMAEAEYEAMGDSCEEPEEAEAEVENEADEETEPAAEDTAAEVEETPAE